jgi:signal peptidase II
VGGVRTARLPLVLAVAAAVATADQLTKWWAVTTLDDRTIDLVWTLRLHLTLNFGSAFSLRWANGPIISLVVVIVVVLLLRSGAGAHSKVAAVGLGLVLGGAAGNLADRMFRAGDGFLGGGVVDFIDLQWWPVFNLADSAVVIGAGLLIISGVPATGGRPEPEHEPRS